ncbi:MAG: DNA repair protein RecO [Nitrospirota bacterium]|jgi:DNA repair protein RecO (recombination protein O)
MLRRTEGIVLKSFPFGEADLIVTYLTRDLGLIKAFAKSPRKIKSRFGSSLEPLTHARLSLRGKEDAALPRLTQSDIINPHQGLREGYDCFLRLSSMLEITLDFLPEGEPNRGAFDLLLRALGMMEGDCSDLGALLYRIRLLALAGYSPRLKDCARCGGAGRRFFVSHGSIICERCAGTLDHAERSDARPLSQGAARLYETLLTWDFSKISRVRAYPGMLRELSDMLDLHLEYTLSKPLRNRVPG